MPRIQITTALLLGVFTAAPAFADDDPYRVRYVERADVNYNANSSASNYRDYVGREYYGRSYDYNGDRNNDRYGNRDQFYTSQDFEQRIERQADLIARGEDSGRLTEFEADRLERRNEQIEGRLDAANDNGINRLEAKQLDRALDQQRQTIRREMRDNQRN